MSKLCQRLAIVGLGLIGGSFGMALRRADVVGEIIGIDTDPNAREDAVRMGAVHRAAGDLAMGIRQAEVVVIATPVGQIPRVLQAMAAHLAPGALVTDVGSSKGSVFLAAKEALPPGVVFIGGHPMAGSERGGIAAADPYLFENAFYVLTPTPEQKDHYLTGKLLELVQATGARPIFMDPWEHDRVVAAVSHLPHMVAAALVNTLAKAASSEVYFSLAAGGFRDTTRIAGGDPYLWRDIFLSNKERVLEMIDEFQGVIRSMRDMLALGQEAELVAALDDARKVRQEIPAKVKGMLAPLYELVVVLADEPGAIGRVAILLAQEGINIVDIEILRVREGEGGTLRLGLGNRESVQRAVSVLRAAGFTARER
jgi:prephenate dehydrogenase